MKLSVASPLQALRASLARLLMPLGFEQALRWLLLGYAVLWLGLLLRLYPSSPLDNVEQFVWSQSLEWGYYKHPPLPTWMLGLATRIFGVDPAVAYAMGACITLGSLVALYWFFKPWLGRETAIVSFLASLCVSYYSSRIHYFNHNTVLTACVVGIAISGYYALANRSLKDWAWVGVWTGLGLLSKYEVVIALVALAAVALQQRAWRDAVHRKGVALSVLVAALIITPHVFWLFKHNFAPFHYAEQSSLGASLPWLLSIYETFNWLLDQLGRVAPGLIVFGIAAWLVKRKLRKQGLALAPYVPPALSNLQKAWLWAFGPGTFIFIAAISLFSEAMPQAQWGTAFALFIPAWFLAIKPWQWLRAGVLRYALIGFLVVQALLLYNMVNMSRSSTDAIARSRFQNFESQLAVQQVREKLRVLGLPTPRYLVGTSFIAGNVKLLWNTPVQVLIEGDFDKSPWIDRKQFEACGALALWPVNEAPEGLIGNELSQRIGFTGAFRLKSEDGPRSALNWGWIEPSGGTCSKQ